jgi:four helix bundle protein
MNRPTAKSFTDLIIWQKAQAFVLAVSKIPEAFPRSEVDGLSSQFRRAATSIAANLAEGFKKRGAADKVRVFNIAQGSLEEGPYDLILAHDLGYAETTAMRPQLDEVAKILEAYISVIRASHS